MAMPDPGTRTFRNRYLGNRERAALRGVVNRLPGFMQRLFPPSDLRRQIRMHPEDRDTIDPEWRVRAGQPAPTPEQIADRRNFILYERSLASIESRNWVVEHNDAEESTRASYIKARTQFAAKKFDALIEDPAITNDIYTDLQNEVYLQHVRGLDAAVLRRAQLALHGYFHLLPVLPAGINSAREARRISFEVIPVVDPDVAAAIGIEPNLPTDPPVFNYADLPDLGNISVTGEDPISFEPFVDGEELVIITQSGYQHKFKRAGITQWLSQQLTNPATGLPTHIGELSRARATVTTGGKRRSKHTKRMMRKKRTTRKMRRY